MANFFPVEKNADTGFSFEGPATESSQYSKLTKYRVLFITQELDSNVSTDIAAALHLLDLQSHDEITIYINSPGGMIADGLLTIYDTMQTIHSPIRTVCIGEAYSGAAVLLAAGTKGKRYAYPSAQIMIHSVQVSEVSGTHSELMEEAKRVNKMNNSLMETIARHTGQSLSKVKKDCKGDKYMLAEEALKYGIIDEILKPTKELPELITKKSRKM